MTATPVPASGAIVSSVGGAVANAIPQNSRKGSKTNAGT